MQPISWPHVVATALSLAFLGIGALYMTTYTPKPFSEQERAASQARVLANCGAGMFDVVPHAARCPRFDAIELQLQPCVPDCEAFQLGLHADGRAVLDVASPASERGRYTASIGSAHFRELGNLVASLKLEHRGGYDPPPTNESTYVVRAGCDGEWTTTANYGGAPGEIEAVTRCLLEVKQRADWSLESDARRQARGDGEAEHSR